MDPFFSDLFRQVSIYVAIGGLGMLLVKALARHRARGDDARLACVACGSTAVQTADDTITCKQCGYTGRADRGGQLSRKEIDALYDPRPIRPEDPRGESTAPRQPPSAPP